MERSFPYDEVSTEREREDPWNILLVVLLRFEDVEYSFDMDLLCALIGDYLQSRNSIDSYSKRNFLERRNARYGLSVYDFLFEYVERLAESGRRGDSRVFHTFADHKKAMRDRVVFLRKRYSIRSTLVDRFEYVHRVSLRIERMYLMYRVAGDRRRLSTLSAQLEDLRDVEIGALEELLVDLGQNR